MSAQFEQCAVCGEHTVVARGSVTQCFGARCGVRRVTSDLQPLERILQSVYEEAHGALLSDPQDSTYQQLLREHRLDARVIAHSLIGVITPDLDVSAQCRTAIEEADAAVEAVRPKGQGRPSKAQALELAMAIAAAKQLREDAGKLMACLDAYRGCVAFFFTDAEHRIVRMRVHGPDGAIATFGKGGLFGHGLFPAFDPPEGLLHRKELFVLEDEWDLLQLQSVSVRTAVEWGHQPESAYLNACATGPYFDALEIRGICRTPIALCGSTGLAFVEQLRRDLNLTASFIGGPLAAFLRRFERPTDAHQALGALIAERQLFTRPFWRVRQEVDSLRGLPRTPPFVKLRWAGERIITDLRERGRLYCDDRLPYVFLHDTKEVIAAERDDERWQLLMYEYGVGTTETDMFPHVGQSLWMAALKDAPRAAVQSMVHYDRKRHVLYLYDHATTVYRIRARGIDRVENGTDGVLFRRNPKWAPFTIDLDARPDFSRIPQVLLASIRIKDVGLTREDVELLIQLWLLTLFFPSLFPTKVILAFIGMPGSGKSSTFKLLGGLLFGGRFEVTDMTGDLRDLDAAITSEAFVAIDNADRRITGLEDKLAVAATGGTIKRRLYYTTNKLVEFPITATLGITSRTPHFRREDVSDRLLPIMLDRFESFGAFGNIEADVSARRDELMSVLVANLRVVVAALEAQSAWHPRTTFRMADFAEFALKVAPALGCPDVQGLLDRLTAVQEQFTMEDDPLFDYLDEWLSTAENQGREVTTRELFEALAAMALRDMRSFEIKTVQELGHALSDRRSMLGRRYGMQERTGRSRKRVFVFRHGPVEEEGEAA